MRGASAERRDQVLFKGAGLWEHYEGKSELLPLPSTLPSFPSLFRDRDLGSLPSPLPGTDEGRSWVLGWAAEQGRRRRRGGRGGRGGGSANYTEQLWGLLKSRMKQRAAEASAAVGAEEPKHHGELEPAVIPAGSNWEHPGDPAALSPTGDSLWHCHRAHCQPPESRGEGAGGCRAQGWAGGQRGQPCYGRGRLGACEDPPGRGEGWLPKEGEPSPFPSPGWRTSER